MPHSLLPTFLLSCCPGVGRGQGRGRAHPAAQAHRQERELLSQQRQPPRHGVQRQVAQVLRHLLTTSNAYLSVYSDNFCLGLE